MEKHVDWLIRIGMVVNVDKTEAVIFSRSPVEQTTIQVKGESFSTRESMKVLGIMFDSRLKWDVHVNNVIKNAKNNIHGLRILRRNLSERNYLKILNAQFFSKMYYGSVVWLGHVSSNDRKRLDSLHYSALRIGCYDFKKCLPRWVLDHDYKRATLTEWSNYSTAREFIRIYSAKDPKCLFDRLDAQSFRTSRPQLVKFFDASKLKIGLQSFANKSSVVSTRLNFDWFFTQHSDDSMRVNLKNAFFKFPSSASDFLITDRLRHQLIEHRRWKMKNSNASQRRIWC